MLEEEEERQTSISSFVNRFLTSCIPSSPRGKIGMFASTYGLICSIEIGSVSFFSGLLSLPLELESDRGKEEDEDGDDHDVKRGSP
jgi:hypothetical protein